MVEYGLLLAFIAIVVIVGVAFFGTQLDNKFDDIGSSVSAVSSRSTITRAPPESPVSDGIAPPASSLTRRASMPTDCRWATATWASNFVPNEPTSMMSMDASYRVDRATEVLRRDGQVPFLREERCPHR
jgi:Flp pilus assembly pilin Flp